MTDEQAFDDQGHRDVEAMARNADLARVTRDWIGFAQGHNYSYHFRWLGRPIIQYPQDIVAMQDMTVPATTGCPEVFIWNVPLPL
jgi:cephalosporin hydroxylase